MAQRFIRCSLCGLPHPAAETECPVHHKPIVPAARVALDAVSALPGPARVPEMSPRLTPDPGASRVPTEAPRPSRTGLHAPLLGALLAGRYRVSGVIAQGGMGVVYEGAHVSVGRPVAIKVLHPRYAADPTAHARFQQEAAVAGSFGHPNIVEVFDVGALDDGTPFMVMERLQGETVSRRLQRERPLSLRLAVEVARQTLNALVATHARGILHRDLKPDNLFLVDRGGGAVRVKVLDFGVAKALYGAAGGAKLTRAGYVMGTPAYMSPEHARGDADLDGGVDLYSLGMILYETLTGRLPFAARSPMALLAEIQRASPPRPRMVRPAVPDALDALVMQCLARDRAERPYDALSMLRDLLAIPLPDDAPPEVTAARELPDGDEHESQAIQVFARR
jgi:serine/threonine-protein kinase